MINPQSLTEALEQQLRNSLCAGLFGDTYDPIAKTGTPKFFADYVQEVAEPYLWIEESSETYEYLSPGPSNLRPYLANGTLSISIIAPNRPLARSLSLAVGGALNDCDQFGVTWNQPNTLPGTLKFFRVLSASFQPITPIGPGAPAVFARVLACQYMYQGAI